MFTGSDSQVPSTPRSAAVEFGARGYSPRFLHDRARPPSASSPSLPRPAVSLLGHRLTSQHSNIQQQQPRHSYCLEANGVGCQRAVDRHHSVVHASPHPYYAGLTGGVIKKFQCTRCLEEHDSKFWFSLSRCYEMQAHTPVPTPHQPVTASITSGESFTRESTITRPQQQAMSEEGGGLVKVSASSGSGSRAAQSNGQRKLDDNPRRDFRSERLSEVRADHQPIQLDDDPAPPPWAAALISAVGRLEQGIDDLKNDVKVALFSTTTSYTIKAALLRLQILKTDAPPGSIGVGSLVVCPSDSTGHPPYLGVLTAFHVVECLFDTAHTTDRGHSQLKLQLSWRDPVSHDTHEWELSSESFLLPGDCPEQPADNRASMKQFCDMIIIPVDAPGSTLSPPRDFPKGMRPLKLSCRKQPLRSVHRGLSSVDRSGKRAATDFPLGGRLVCAGNNDDGHFDYDCYEGCSGAPLVDEVGEVSFVHAATYEGPIDPEEIRKKFKEETLPSFQKQRPETSAQPPSKGTSEKSNFPSDEVQASARDQDSLSGTSASGSADQGLGGHPAEEKEELNPSHGALCRGVIVARYETVRKFTLQSGKWVLTSPSAALGHGTEEGRALSSDATPSRTRHMDCPQRSWECVPTNLSSEEHRRLEVLTAACVPGSDAELLLRSSKGDSLLARALLGAITWTQGSSELQPSLPTQPLPPRVSQLLTLWLGAGKFTLTALAGVLEKETLCTFDQQQFADVVVSYLRGLRLVIVPGTNKLGFTLGNGSVYLNAAFPAHHSSAAGSAAGDFFSDAEIVILCVTALHEFAHYARMKLVSMELTPPTLMCESGEALECALNHGERISVYTRHGRGHVNERAVNGLLGWNGEAPWPLPRRVKFNSAPDVVG